MTHARLAIRGTLRYTTIGLVLVAAASVGLSVAVGVWAQQQPQEKTKPRGPSRSSATPDPRAKTPAAARTPRPGANESILHPHGRHWADIRDFGAKPDGSDCTLAIQAAHDSLLDARGLAGIQNSTRGVVYVPTGKWTCFSPVWFDGDRIELRGDGPASILTTQNVGCSPIMLGMKRKTIWREGTVFAKLPTTFAIDHRVDLFGKLDQSTVSAPGQLFGLRSLPPSNHTGRPDHFLTFWANPPCFGAFDYWENTQTLTLQFCFEHSSGKQIGKGALMGMGGKEDFSGPGPWILATTDSTYSDFKYHFSFRTKEGVRNTADSSRDFSFGNTAVSGIQRVALQIDFRHNNADGVCAIHAYINGVQVPVTRGFGTRLATATDTEPSFKAEDNLHFRPNETTTFNIFAAAFTPNYPLYGISDYNLYGLRIGNALLYKDRGPGQREQRIDNKPINDHLRYFDAQTDLASTICWLPMTDKPHEPTHASDRLVTVRHGTAARGYQSFAMFTLNERDFAMFNVTTGNKLYDIRLETAQDSGAALALGSCFECWLTNCEFAGGWYGVGSMNMGGYDYKLRNNTMFGRDAAFYGLGMMIESDTMTRTDVGRTFLRLGNCKAKFNNIKTGNMDSGTKTDALIKIHGYGGYASEYEFDAIETDNENSSAPMTALIYIERHPANVTILKVSNIVTGNLAPGVPVIKLVDTSIPLDGISFGPGYLWARHILSSDGFIVQTDGPKWRGVITDSVETLLIEPIRNTGPNGVGHVVMESRVFELPKAGRFAKGAHRLIIWNPEPGEPAEYVCTQSGTAEWSPNHLYNINAFVSFEGTEYKAVKTNTNSKPPGADWTPLGPASPPVWKAVATVAP